MITEGVFLCVGEVHIEVLFGIAMNDLLHCGTEGRYVNDRMDTGLQIAGTGQRWLDLKLRMKPWLVERLLEALVSTCSVSNTGVLLRVADGKSEASQLGWSLETLGTCWTCLFSLLSLCVGSFPPTSRRRVRDHVNNACLRDIVVRSGSCHLVDTCTWLIVAHRHARTSSHSAERLNLCLSGKELLRMLHMSLHLSVFPVICALSLFIHSPRSFWMSLASWLTALVPGLLGLGKFGILFLVLLFIVEQWIGLCELQTWIVSFPGPLSLRPRPMYTLS